MKRRSFTTGCGLAVSAALGGCLGSADPSDKQESAGWEPTVTASDPELKAGDEATLTVEATDVSGVWISKQPDSDAIEMAFSAVELSPSPATVYTMHPPAWIWDTRTDVELEIPITVSAEADPAEYPYEITVYDTVHDEGIEMTPDSEESEAEWESLKKAFSITVD